MMEQAAWLGLLLSTEAPALPAAWIMQTYRTVGWALVLGLLLVMLGGRLALPAKRLLAGTVALWVLLPGPYSPDYWLGLAFHAPSLVAALLCAWLLWARLLPVQGVPAAVGSGLQASPLWLLLAGVGLGYGLMLDTFAVLPVQAYAWGFSPALLLGLLALGLLPWVLRGLALDAGSAAWLAPAALLLFAATRLPTGNVWDALLDPWLWLLLQILLIRHLVRKWRN